MATSSDMVRSFEILLSRKSTVDAALTALVKRAARKGIEGVLAWEWGKAFASTANVPNIDGTKPCDSALLSVDGSFWTVPVARIPLALTGETPRIQGWRFIATLQHLDGENIVRTLPNEDLSVEYRTRGPMCDHCRSLRRRNDTYVLRHEDGRTIQVGSSCLEDFLGSDDAAKLAARAETLALALAACESDDEGSGGGSSVSEVLMPEYLEIVAWCVRETGWTSRAVARDTDGSATADCAWNLLFSAKARADAKCEPTGEDRELALAAEGWGESLTDEVVNGATSDYLHNLRAVCRTGRVEFRTAGIAASAVTAYQRFVGAERARAERKTLNVYVGNVGDKVTFGLPAEVTKKGKPKKGAPIVLSMDPVTLEFVTGYETSYGYTTVLKFRTVDGATLVWKASSVELSRADVGRRYTLAGSIKAHEEYKGAKQTILTRCSVIEVPGETSLAA